MRFDDDIPLLFGDFGVPAIFGSATASVLLDMPGEDIFGGAQQSTEYAITYRASELPGLSAGDAITVDGVAYKVRQVKPLDDGKLSQATLKR